jgi:hypothetical protein
MSFVAGVDAARKEIEQILRRTARNQTTTTYSAVVEEVTALTLRPDSEVLASLLDDISRDENNAGRGMLSAVVVHADDGLPGDGFFKLAKTLGRPVEDRAVFHASELVNVLAANKPSTPR